VVAVPINNIPIGILSQEAISRVRGSQQRMKQPAFSSYSNQQHPLAC